ncbi:MAG: acetylglutamate kinase [Myxococcota bacterium]
MAHLIVVVKAGGDLAANPEWAASVANDIAALHRDGHRVVLVHGGGPQLDDALAADGLPITKVAGRRTTPPEVLARAVQIWRGTLSVQWVTALREAGVAGVGLCGSDGGLLVADVRPPREIDGTVVDFGEVGDLHTVDPTVLVALLKAHLVPVISPLAATSAGRVLNVNADTVAAHVAAALEADALVVLTRAPGILTDPADPSSLLAHTTLPELAELERTGAIRDGMRPKIAAIATALKRGVTRALVVDGRRPGAARNALSGVPGSGTAIAEGPARG